MSACSSKHVEMSIGGLRNTIANNPEMFLAYNNGITATAEEHRDRGVS